jgi:hypothetical protein
MCPSRTSLLHVPRTAQVEVREFMFARTAACATGDDHFRHKTRLGCSRAAVDKRGGFIPPACVQPTTSPARVVPSPRLLARGHRGHFGDAACLNECAGERCHQHGDGCFAPYWHNDSSKDRRPGTTDVSIESRAAAEHICRRTLQQLTKCNGVILPCQTR